MKRPSKPVQALRLASLSTLGLALSLTYSQQAMAQATDAQTTEAIVVSASRIERSGFTAPTPTTTIGAADLQARAATTVSSVLFDLPAVRPQISGTGQSQNIGGSYVNLRGLGNVRTLVLVDGHRFVPTTVRGEVDSNMVPSALVERVEVVTGGASAAWGSDAVAGVTNFIFKKSIDGFQGNVQYGMSSHGDNKEKSASLAWGSGFADDRGQFMIAGEYSKLDDNPQQKDRDWSSQNWNLLTGGTPANGGYVSNGVIYSNAILPNVTFIGNPNGVIMATAPGPAPALLPAGNPLAGKQFGPGGILQNYTFGQYAGISGNLLQVGGDGTASNMQNTLLTSPLERKNLYARATFDFTSNLDGFAEASYGDSKSSIAFLDIYNPNLGDSVLSITPQNAFLSPSVVALMNGNNFGLVRLNTELGRITSVVDNKTTRFAAGLNGQISSTWKWKAYYTHGKTEYDSQLRNNLIQANWRASVDSVKDANGNPICRINSTNPADIAIVNATNAAGVPTYAGYGASAGCVPVNLFGPNTITQAVKDYVIGNQVFNVDYIQDAGAASLQGEPFSTWAGNVSLAGGLEWRKEKIDGNSDAISSSSSLVYPAGGFQIGNPKRIIGSVTVKEFFAETLVPLLKDAPLAKSLDANAAVRRTEYSTSGFVTTWKAGFTYKPVQDITLRATRSRDIRAANLNELYAGSQLTVAAVAGTSVANTTIGNSSLTPEKADTVTAGVVLEPSQVKGLRMSLDGYKIKLNNAIGTLGAATIYNFCKGLGGAPLTPSYCNLITFNSSGLPTAVTNQTLNFAGYTTSGADLEVSYRVPVSSFIASTPGNLTFRALGTYINDLSFNNGITKINYAGSAGVAAAANGVGAPHWRWNLSTTYANGPLSVFAQLRYIQSMNYDNTAGPTSYLNGTLPSRTYVDASVSYTVYDKTDQGRGRVQLYGKVNNLFDKDPPIAPTNNPQTSASSTNGLYDLVGRAFVLGVRFAY